MKDDLQKRINTLVKEKGVYAMALIVIIGILLSVNFPVYLLAFFGVFVFFVWKAFSQPQRNEVRGIFEFYLAANEMLRDDEKRWFGFEMQEILHSGERILNTMPDPPPLMLFTLGALHHKLGNYEAAVQFLSNVQENEQIDEKHRLIASPELKSYVKILRKIEREPAEAPQTSAAVRALERARRNRAGVLLEDSRKKALAVKEGKIGMLSEKARDDQSFLDLTASIVDAGHSNNQNTAVFEHASNNGVKSLFENNGHDEGDDPQAFKKERTDRKSISEVLKDIYDR
ncbi:MAG TPA: hypothetical protein VGO50_17210 [Pyrinomonadaceae bacterium]|nr:hypothetical protein [Pyrinomonadaceae bacterium]